MMWNTFRASSSDQSEFETADFMCLTYVSQSTENLSTVTTRLSPATKKMTLTECPCVRRA